MNKNYIYLMNIYIYIIYIYIFNEKMCLAIYNVMCKTLYQLQS